MSNILSGKSSLTYQGTNAINPPNLTYHKANPTSNNYQNFSVGDIWINTANTTAWILTRIANFTAYWVQVGGGSGTPTNLQGNSGGIVMPTGGVINVVGDNGNNINIVGNPGTSTLTAALYGTTNHALQLGNASGSLTSLGVATNGQLPIGSAGANPVLATLTAGSNVTITNGPGSITISAAGSGSAFTTINIQLFTTSGTYTPTSGMQYCIIEVVAGGGGGGGAFTTNSTEVSPGGGGGAGGYARAAFSAATIGASQPVTVGLGGTPGNDGTASYVGTFPYLIAASAGIGGSQGNSNNIAYGRPGAGGGAGDLPSYFGVTGQSGQTGFGMYINSTLNYAIGGAGGNSVLGFGGKANLVIGVGTLNGDNGVVYGSGGAGAANGPSQSIQTGANGAPGIVIITEYIS